MRTLTVSTCGTSTLTNGESPADKKFLYDKADCRKEDFSPEELSRVDGIVSAKLDKMLNASLGETRGLSAELNGFIGFYGGGAGLDEARQDEHYLIHTDTYLGHSAAELLRLWAENRKITMNLVPVEDLRIGNVEDFQMGINNLVQWCADTIPGYRSQGYRVVFNPIGGFKALQGYMQTLGMFYADETIYIFETSNELLRIPRIPADFNAQARQSVLDNFVKFRLMQKESLDRSECAGIPETLLDILDGRCSLSAWGRVIFEDVQHSAYSGKLLEPLSERIVITQKVYDIAKFMMPDRIMRLNQAVDKLSRQIDKGEFLRSCNFRPLIDDPHPPSTHEFNLWPDMGGWRGFCHWEGRKLIIDDIDMGIGHK